MKIHLRLNPYWASRFLEDCKQQPRIPTFKKSLQTSANNGIIPIPTAVTS